MTEYKDKNNKIHKLIQRISSKCDGIAYTEEEIIDALYKIFTSK